MNPEEEGSAPGEEAPPSSTSPVGAPDTEEAGDPLNEQADAAEDFLNGLLDELDMEGEAEADIEDDDTISVGLEGPDMAVLIGRGGATLEALQDLTRGAVHTRTGARALLTLDIGGYRDRQRQRLRRRAQEAAEQAVREARPVALEPMGSFERLVVHQALADRDDVTTSSIGEDPDRHVVVSPA